MSGRTKVLDGRELAEFIKARQAGEVRSLRGRGVAPKLVIVRDSDNPVIVKYVKLKREYGEDIGVEVADEKVADAAGAKEAIAAANADASVQGIIVQLPLADKTATDEVVAEIAPEKDMDGLSGKGDYDSATATAINWLLAGHNIDLDDKKIAVVGRGRLVGAPLLAMWRASGLDVDEFGRDGDLTKLKEYDVIVSATGQPHLIAAEMVKAGAVIVDAGTASEDGVLVGDVDDAVRAREGLLAITPKVGGVGPLTVGALFENVITAAKKTVK